MRAHERDCFKDLLKQIKGVAFFGTPHTGSSTAKFGEILASIAKASSLGTRTNVKLLADLKNNSDTLWSVAKSFVDRGKELRIISFYETEKMEFMNCLVSLTKIEKAEDEGNDGSSDER